MKSQSIDKFGFQGGMFTSEAANTTHISIDDQNLNSESTMPRICTVLKNPVFVLLTLAISGLYFVVCGL